MRQGGGGVDRTDDEIVVRNYKPEPNAREAQSRKVVPRAVYWLERWGFCF